MNLSKHLSILLLVIIAYAFSFPSYFYINYLMAFSSLILLYILEKLGT